LGTVHSNGFRKLTVLGTYPLANLLQSLTVAHEDEVRYIVIPGDGLTENPVDRLSRLIKQTFWPSLTRRLDENMIEKAAKDEKDWTDDPRPRIYVPMAEPEQVQYYMSIAKRRPELRLDVQIVPKHVTAEVYLEMLKKPGLLALAMDKDIQDVTTEGKELRSNKLPKLEGVPFIVPGGRFNELYGWDSFFTTLGLLSDGYLDVAKGIVRNFVFEIQHYGLIPNANRSYYLLRSQPPFLTNLALRVYEATMLEPGAKECLRRAILAAIKEYNQVWMSEPRLDRRTGLSRYRPKGFGIPPETEKSHFNKVLAPYAELRAMSVAEFREAYNNGMIQEPELDTYFLHDRAVRESGHDVSVRLESVCGDMATVDLNCCLYKYEKDIAHVIRTHFGDRLVVPGEFCAPGEVPNHVEASAEWLRKARKRKMRIDHFLWNEEKGSYFDYNTAKHQQSTYETATCFWTMWCGVASPHQASSLVSKSLPKFECAGGLSVGTEDFRGRLTCHDSHQWDYPYGWAPHQILAWDGMRNYGYHHEAERLAYRWLHIITKMYVDYGAVVEKYDTTNIVDGHKVFAEYGNQGLVFSGYAREG
jgi:alpha,alpha-trehalase